MLIKLCISIIIIILLIFYYYKEQFTISSGSCRSKCGYVGSDSTCYCDSKCKELNDCCSDFKEQCGETNDSNDFDKQKFIHFLMVQENIINNTKNKLNTLIADIKKFN